MLTEKDFEQAIDWVNRTERKQTIQFEYMMNENGYCVDEGGRRIQVPVMKDGRPVMVEDVEQQLILHFMRENVLPIEELGSIIGVRNGKYFYYRIKKVVKLDNGSKKAIMVQDRNLSKCLFKMYQEIKRFKDTVYVGSERFTPEDTLYDACVSWYRHHAEVSQNREGTVGGTLKKIEILNRNELKKITGKKISDLTHREMKSLSEQLAEIPRLIVGPNRQTIVGTQPYAPQTLKTLWWCVKSTFDYLRITYPGYPDVLQNVSPPFKSDAQKDRQSIKYNCLDEVSMLIFEAIATTKYANGQPYFKAGDALVFLMYSGLRKAEFCGLTKDDYISYPNGGGEVDVNKQLKENKVPVEEDGKVKIKSKLILSKDLKTKKSKRKVQFGSEVADIIKKRLKINTTTEKDFLFKPFYRKDGTNNFDIDPRLLPSYKSLQNKAHMDPVSLNDSLRAVLKNCILHPSFNQYKDFDVDSFTVHDLRHTAISHQLRMGIPLQDVANFAGHNDLNTTMIYYNQVAAQRKRFSEMTRQSNAKEPDRITVYMEINGKNRELDNEKLMVDAADLKKMMDGFLELKQNSKYLPGMKGRPHDTTNYDFAINNLPAQFTYEYFPTAKDISTRYQNIRGARFEYTGEETLKMITSNMITFHRNGIKPADILNNIMDFVAPYNAKETFYIQLGNIAYEVFTGDTDCYLLNQDDGLTNFLLSYRTKFKNSGDPVFMNTIKELVIVLRIKDYIYKVKDAKQAENVILLNIINKLINYIKEREQ